MILAAGVASGEWWGVAVSAGRGRWSGSDDRSGRRVTSLLLALFAGACVVYVFVSPFLRSNLQLVNQIPDDAAYYFQIGRNYADGSRFS